MEVLLPVGVLPLTCGGLGQVLSRGDDREWRGHFAPEGADGMELRPAAALRELVLEEALPGLRIGRFGAGSDW